jgi:hypothetical protein
MILELIFLLNYDFEYLIMVVLEQEILLELTVFHLHDKMYHQVLEYLMMIMHLLNIDLNHMLMLENDHHLSKYLTIKKHPFK